MDCIFCKIVAGEIPCSKVYEDENVLAFHDISPMAKTHVLVIPKVHVNSCADITEDNAKIVSDIFVAIGKIATMLELKDGFRVVTNSGAYGCQSVNHLHFHILGSEQLSPNMA